MSNFKYPEAFTLLLKEYGIEESDQVWESLGHGTAIIDNKKQLNQYLYSYGKMHHRKLTDAYAELFKDLKDNTKFNNSTQIEIIDYGCGQGIASIILLNIFEKFNFPIENISKITLIEPSQLALERADFFLNKSAKIVKINKYLDDMNTSDIETADSAVKIHLFSNILDMKEGDEYGEHFSLETLSNNIKSSQSDENYFICVSVRNEEYLDEFAEEIMETKLENIKFISINNKSIKKGRNGMFNPWYRIHMIFKKNYLNE